MDVVTSCYYDCIVTLKKNPYISLDINNSIYKPDT